MLGMLKHGWSGCTYVYDFFCCVIQQFFKDQCVTKATSLAYTSLFSLMPVLLVGYTIFSGFPEFAQLGPKMQAFILMIQ